MDINKIKAMQEKTQEMHILATKLQKIKEPTKESIGQAEQVIKNLKELLELMKQTGIPHFFIKGAEQQIIQIEKLKNEWKIKLNIEK